MQQLTTTDHSRDVAGLKYVYPVVSRRAGGISIGINFNTNNACNWRCVYCQVPDLKRGIAPPVDFECLEQELHFFFQHLKSGDFYRQFNVDESLRQIKDIALSGNGEPTSVPEFAQAIELIADIAKQYQLLPTCHFVLITNGSLVHRQKVQQGLKQLQHHGGEVWFKIDRGTMQERKIINDCREDNNTIIERLNQSNMVCPTKIQTCLLDYPLAPWHEQAQQDFVTFFKRLRTQCTVIDIMLYSIARPSLQPEAESIRAIESADMQRFAQQLKTLGFTVSVA